MKTRHTWYRRMWLVTAFAGLLVTAGIGAGRIEPAGRSAGLVQFDVINELNMEEIETNTVVFARCWVSRDYYAVSVAWCEPHGGGLMSFWKTLAVLSDKDGFRVADEECHDYPVVNTTYSRPFGKREPFVAGKDGIARIAEMRFADVEAVSKRVYVSDFTTLAGSNGEASRAVDLKVRTVVDGVKRKLAQVKARVQGDRIESMELLDNRQQSLGRLKYEYERTGSASSLARLVAELPERLEKQAVDVTRTIISESGDSRTYTVKDIDHVYHRGDRTCTVAYEDVTIADRVVRLPVRAEVRSGRDKRLVRSARLINFKRVDLDKAAVWEAAKAFAGLSREDRQYRLLLDKYLYWKPKPGPMQVDANDLAFVRRLIARYPVSRSSASSSRTRTEPSDPRERARLRRNEARAGTREREEGLMNPPEVPRLDIEPNDLRVIRQLRTYYDKTAFAPTTQEQRAEGGLVSRTIAEGKAEIAALHAQLTHIVSYHRAPALPEDTPPRIDANDLERIRQLQRHYEAIATQEDRTLAGRLKAVDALIRLDMTLKDYDAFEAHATRYLQILQDADLMTMYMRGGYNNLWWLVKAGRYDKANKLMRQWADKSATGNGPDAVYCFVGWDLYGQASPWAGVQLLDRFLRKPGLSPLQRYEGLALRAIALDKIDKWLADPKAAEDEDRKAQMQWALSSTRREELAGRVQPALHQAVSAWQSLGPARLTDAGPYSTANRPDPGTRSLRDAPDMLAMQKRASDATQAARLQKTSALLDQIVRQRMEQTQSRQSGPRR